MVKSNLHVTAVGFVALIGGLLALPVQAATIYDAGFQLNVTGGFYTGTYQGTLSYSDEFLTGTGHEVLVPGPNPDGFLKAGFLSLSFEYAGQTFTMADDGGGDPVNYPWLYFNNGSIAGLDYYGDDQFGQFVVGIGMTDLFIGPLSNTRSIGDVTFFAPVARVSAVPEPGTLALLGVGSVLILATWRRRAKRAG